MTYHDKYGEPTTLNDYDYELLYGIAKDLSTTDLKDFEFRHTILAMNCKRETLIDLKK